MTHAKRMIFRCQPDVVFIKMFMPAWLLHKLKLQISPFFIQEKVNKDTVGFVHDFLSVTHKENTIFHFAE